MDRLLCPKCNHLLDDATCLNGDAQPQDGDISSCLYCGAALVFIDKDGKRSLRLMSEEEIMDLPQDMKMLLSASMSIGVIVRAKGEK